VYKIQSLALGLVKTE